MLAGLSVIGTGVFMMKRVRTPFFVRNPYLFSDMTWGWMYVLHGLAGIGFVGLVTVHIYFAIRPEKLFITKSMIFGTISRENSASIRLKTRGTTASSCCPVWR